MSLHEPRDFLRTEWSEVYKEDVVVSPRPYLISWRPEDPVPENIKLKLMERCWAAQTNDDGACAVHSVFGQVAALRFDVPFSTASALFMCCAKQNVLGTQLSVGNFCSTNSCIFFGRTDIEWFLFVSFLRSYCILLEFSAVSSVKAVVKAKRTS